MRSWMTHPLVILGAAALIIFGLFLARRTPEERPRPDASPLVRTIVARAAPHRFLVTSQGSVSPRRESDLIPQVTGEVVWVSPTLVPGGFFEAGDVLARIDPADYRVDRESARASVARAQSEFDRARKERDRQRRLADRSVASEARIDDAVRPNQLFALTLGLDLPPPIGGGILKACERLIVPGGIRSLADGPVSLPLEIRHQGQMLGDPLHPYRGRYAGDEDTRRKPAYHNGTAWTWVFPSFCEAWYRVYGPAGRAAALAWLGSAVEQMQGGCLGHIAEILDGDAPHAPRGCDAQAWSVSEILRVWRLLTAAQDE